MPTTQDKRFISLKPLYEYARKHKTEENPIKLGRGNPNGYSAICKDLTKKVDGKQGFYVWGFYDGKKYWHSIYVGMVRTGKTASLKSRIFEELLDERWFLWRHVFTEKRILELSDEIRRSESRRKGCKRAMQKKQATHIVWVPAELARREHVLSIEADLIEAINPQANQKRPTPPKTVQKEATRIFQAFRRTIHSARDTEFDAAPKEA